MKLPRSFYNPISLIGSILAGASLFIILFFMLAMWLFDVGSSYLGLFVFIILPVFLLLGLILIPVGMVRRSKRIKEDPDKVRTIGVVIDLRDQRQWNAVAVFIWVTFLFLLLTGIGSYHAYHYTESNEFCGTLCHKVMEPEYTAYQDSPHSRVTCVECHVGEGAGWYVKSKLSGLYQVYSVLANKYPQPIETPIENLRPAQETCEECHWPEKFYSRRLHNEKHYLTDSANTEWNIQLKMKIGSEHSAGGLEEGIHWHVNRNVRIEYIASDEKREFLPWVKYTNLATGDTVIYEDLYVPLDSAARDTLETRVMDCLDCHNRPSHHYLPPQEFTDNLMASADIPPDLPEIKRLAMEVFYTPFEDRESGRDRIRQTITEFYSTNYPEIMEERPGQVEQAIEGFNTGFSKNFFPYMNASWDVYPNHVGHVEFNGCFRCHNDIHESGDGEIISKDCNLCHTIVGQGSPDNYRTVSIGESLEFEHPVDIDGAWRDMACADCHRYLY